VTQAVDAVLESGLAELAFGAERSTRVLPVLARYCELFHTWSQRLNLTAHADAVSIAGQLVLDAVALEGVLPPARRIVDVGSGAGIPGVPIAILRPDSSILLIEARERRHHFLRMATRELGLPNVRALHGRAEAIDPDPHDCAVAQAAGPMATVIDWLVRWTVPGGSIAIPISPDQPVPTAPPSIARAEVRPYRVPLSGRARAVWVGIRAGE
jgi:16S rRNA (guanine527-N7)-methyltransferase